jgi:hypothetical protein
MTTPARSVVLLIAAVIFTFSGMSVDMSPFTPMTPQPDYWSIRVEKSDARDNGSRIVTHHGHWTRLERMNGYHRTSEFYSAASGAKATVRGQLSITLERRIDATPGIDFEARRTGERQTFLGETARCGMFGGHSNRSTAPTCPIRAALPMTASRCGRKRSADSFSDESGQRGLFVRRNTKISTSATAL